MDDTPGNEPRHGASSRLPWELVETLPSTDAALIDRWERAVEDAVGDAARVRALVGRSLVSYWAVHAGLDARSAEQNLADRRRDTAEAVQLARPVGDPDLLATALLGSLTACWGPDQLDQRADLLAEVAALADLVDDEELRLRIREWEIIDRFDHGDLDGARRLVAAFAHATSDTDLVLFRRRTELWRANLAMLDGDPDAAVRINTEAVRSTATLSGAPFSVQNAAVTKAIERHFRRGLGELVDVIRSVRASSPRVGANWDSALAFALGETGQLDEARELLDRLAANRFSAVPRDLNWLVTMQLLALVAARVGDRARAQELSTLLEPFGHLDGTHGSGYASYGPVARNLGLLAGACGDQHSAVTWFEQVLRTREPGPWTALTRLHLAEALACAEPVRAATEANQAARELAACGLDSWVDDAHAVRRATSRAGVAPRGPVATHTAAGWVLKHPTGTATVPDTVGVRLLVRLLVRPGRPLAAAELEGAGPGLPTASTHEAPSDPAARAAYRRRLVELEGRRRPLRPAEVVEVAALRRELSRSKYAPATSAELERARVRVTKALRRAVVAVLQVNPHLGEHLEESISTGRRCCYAPADGVAWRVTHPR